MTENPSHVLDLKPVRGGVYPHNPGSTHLAHAMPHTMHLPGQIDELQDGNSVQPVQNYGSHLPGKMIDVPGGRNNHRDSQYLQQYASEQDHGVHHTKGENRMEEDQDGDGDSEGMEGDVPSETGNFAVMAAPRVGNQLTLSFQGEVYVFDSVSPEKVQAVLLLLGGHELTSGVASTPSSQQNNRRSNFPHRVASLMRFREKRKERNFDKKIRYTVRKDVALRMQRNKGQFTSSKSKPEDATLGVTSWDATQGWGAMDNRPQAAPACHHCGISVKSTPMMRRGPDGPRTLCNACGLMWANKGTLKDLSKNPSAAIQGSSLGPNEENEVVGTEGEEPLAVTANGHDSS